ncbi:MAG: ATP-binding protein [Candidatus Moraniibacteriota bacterium]
MKYFKRELEDRLEENLSNEKVLVLTGMRRTGKTTLLRRFFDKKAGSNKVWFDLENPLEARYFQDVDYNDVFEKIVNYGNLDRNKRIWVFIDEAQNYPEVTKVVKYLVDHYDIKFILTGSASYYLKNLFPESLAGRKRLFELFPLSFREFLLFKGENLDRYDKIRQKKQIKLTDYEYYDQHYKEFIKWGGFPEVVLASKQQEKKDVLDDVLSSYWQKEIINLADYRKSDKVRDLLVLLAARAGSKLDINRLSQELEVTRATVYSYLSFLEATYFIFTISKFSGSADRRISGHDKLYFCDNGILRILGQKNEGQLLENSLFNQLRSKNESVLYYEKKTGSEIDFVAGGVGYEIKRTATESDIKKLKRSMKMAGVKKGYVVSLKYVEDKPDTLFAQFV